MPSSGRPASAVDGVDAVNQTLGVAAGPATIFKPIRLFSDATRILVAAMQEIGVKRLICVTGFGAGDSCNKGGCLHDAAFQLFLGRTYADKDVQEEVIRKSKLEWVIARPTISADGSKTGACRVLADPRDWRRGFILRADVADFLAKQIGNAAYVGKTPVPTGQGVGHVERQNVAGWQVRFPNQLQAPQTDDPKATHDCMHRRRIR
jgi:putative NADH-flavin reductase